LSTFSLADRIFRLTFRLAEFTRNAENPATADFQILGLNTAEVTCNNV